MKPLLTIAIFSLAIGFGLWAGSLISHSIAVNDQNLILVDQTKSIKEQNHLLRTNVVTLGGSLLETQKVCGIINNADTTAGPR